MATKLDPSELVSFKELLIANSIQIDTAVQLMIEKELITEQRFFTKLKQTQVQYQAILMLKKIISGGQTGADRAALDFAIKHKISNGGWIPERKARRRWPPAFQIQAHPNAERHLPEKNRAECHQVKWQPDSFLWKTH